MTRQPNEKSGKRTVDRIYDIVRREILSGVRQPGEKLRESAIAQEHGVSRTPVRFALQHLAGDGFATAVANSGVVVKSFSPDAIDDIYGVRVLLEGEAAAKSAVSASRQDIETLADLCDEMDDTSILRVDDKSEVIERLSELNRAYHVKILAMSGNAALQESGERLLDIGFLINTYRKYRPPAIERSLSDHRHLLEALKFGDPDWARAVMQSHILRARRSFRSS